MRGIRHAADRIGDDDDAVTELDRAEHRAQHADIGFRARDHQSVYPAFLQPPVQRGPGERRIALLVDDLGGRHKFAQRRQQRNELGMHLLARQMTPARKITTPCAAALLRS